MASSINASTTAGVVTTADTSGVLNIQTAGVTAISIDASQAVTMAGRTSNPTTISVGGATPSTSGSGITFSATQSASSNANTLDDYEEGTWTAAFVPSTSGTITMNNATGTYTKVGRVVTLNGNLTVTSVSSPVGYLQITGLPFSGGTGNSFRCALAINNENMNATMNTVLIANIQSGSLIYVFKNDGVGGVALTTAADVKAGTNIFIGGTYTTD